MEKKLDIYSKFYALDPVFAKQQIDKVDNMSEIDLWLCIYTLNNYIAIYTRDMVNSRNFNFELTEEHRALETLIYQTQRFGVKLSNPKPGYSIWQGSTDYYNWYTFYLHHFTEILSDEEWNSFKEAYKEGKDFSAFLPQGNWQKSNQDDITLGVK